jgi:N-acetylmuramoyl-L-alanine amidase
MKVSVNAGHMIGVDPGAVGPNGTRESDVTKSVAERLCALLQYFGHETQFIQSNSLEDICNEANQFGAEIFISIHCNAAENPAAHGTETYYCEGSGIGSRLAQYVNSSLSGMGLTNRGTKTADYYVLKYTDMPAILTELAFISNPDEEALLADENSQQTFAEVICRAINAFAGV